MALTSYVIWPESKVETSLNLNAFEPVLYSEIAPTLVINKKLAKGQTPQIASEKPDNISQVQGVLAASMTITEQVNEIKTYTPKQQTANFRAIGGVAELRKQALINLPEMLKHFDTNHLDMQLSPLIEQGYSAQTTADIRKQLTDNQLDNYLEFIECSNTYCAIVTSEGHDASSMAPAQAFCGQVDNTSCAFFFTHNQIAQDPLCDHLKSQNQFDKDYSECISAQMNLNNPSYEAGTVVFIEFATKEYLIQPYDYQFIELNHETATEQMTQLWSQIIAETQRKTGFSPEVVKQSCRKGICTVQVIYPEFATVNDIANPHCNLMGSTVLRKIPEHLDQNIVWQKHRFKCAAVMF